ncbi:MAG: multiple sugar transport system permease protein [Thermomicrobiales bacterium]|nr:multiple sugar transport system permease protein [Thermomicrobiales bacterium]MEA2594694.1 multiple sugar transport system permease protein [Thermomicrobiales bacterium]
MQRATVARDRLPVEAGRRSQRYRPGVRGTGILMVLPVVLLVAVFTLYPFGQALYDSMRLTSPFFPARFVGLDNFRGVIGSTYFADAVRVTLTFTAIAVPATVVTSLLIALLLNERFVGNTALRAGMLLPWALPASITGIVWKWMFLDSWGAINVGLYELGVIDKYITWLTSPRLAMMAVVIAFVWAQTPLATALLLVAVQGVPQDLYAAASLDGAAATGRFRDITLPIIRPTLVIVALYQILMAFTTFDITYALTHGGPGTATTMLTYFTWAESFKMLDFGRGASLAILVALSSIVVIVVLLRAMPKDALLEEAR